MSDQKIAVALDERIKRVLPRLSYRRAVAPEYRREIFRLRHDAYVKEGAITPQPDGLFTDGVDEAENTLLFGVHVDGVLMSSIRFSIGYGSDCRVPTAKVFPDILDEEQARGRIIIDPTRFVVDAAASRRQPELPYVTLRLPWMAMEHFEADILLAAVRLEHAPFYRRFWNTRVLAPARTYPLLAKPIVLTAADYPEALDIVQGRYPFMASSAAEREELFGVPGRVHRASGRAFGHVPAQAA